MLMCMDFANYKHRRKKKNILCVLASWCSVPARPPGGERKPQKYFLVHNKFHFRTTVKIAYVTFNGATVDNHHICV